MVRDGLMRRASDLAALPVVCLVGLAAPAPAYGSGRVDVARSPTYAYDDSTIDTGSYPQTEAPLLSVVRSISSVVGNDYDFSGSLVATKGTGVIDDALSGGRHSGFLDNYAGRSPAEIQRGIRSLEGQIDDHLRWIDDPYQKIPDWDKLDPRQQQALLTQKWPGDIQRQREQLEILRYLLEQGGS